MNDILFHAFHDELEKVAGAKRLLRLSKVRHKSDQHEEAYRRATKAYERRISQHGLSERQRVNPYKDRTDLSGPGDMYGALAGTLAGGVAGALGDVGLAPGLWLGMGGLSFGAAGGAAAQELFDEGRKYLFHRRSGRAAKNYLQRVGMPRDSIDSIARNKYSPFISKEPSLALADGGAQAIASRAVRAGSPKDIPTDILRRGQKATTAAKPQGGKAEPRRQENQARARRLARIRNE
jgi:hypothetical protein